MSSSGLAKLRSSKKRLMSQRKRNPPRRLGWVTMLKAMLMRIR